MSSSSTESGTSPPPPEDEREELAKPVSEMIKPVRSGRPPREPGSDMHPLIIAAYRYGDPFRKRRVKVPPHLNWTEFLDLLCSRLEVTAEHDIEIYDESGIEIVSVEDLVPNDVLVIRERRKKVTSDFSRYGYHPPQERARPSEGERGSMLQQSDIPQQHTSHYPSSSVSRRSHDSSCDPVGPIRSHEQPSPPMGTAQLTHFIRSNCFGQYFLAEVENVRLPVSGKIKKAHCVVKVPPCDKSTDFSQTFEMEAKLLRKLSHRSVIAAPSIQILNFANETLQRFFLHLPEHKQPPLAELFFSGTCSEAYIYPLYGVTMATKIKSGLSPEKTLKYAYQLAETMQYLQQKGVIHQTLLPENIQVMSNDRVVVCNFETAVQTDPASCTLVVSRSLVAPSNRMGLAPEVVSTFNRSDAEAVDYSTQYPWSFGTLSVVMATGQHPLRGYPGRLLVEGRVKYRSHNYQALPDANQYPSLFCRLVKRSLSCDPIRRPSLFQITSIMKKDGRTLTIMSGRRYGGSAVGSKSTSSRSPGQEHREMIDVERNGEQGDPYPQSRHRGHPSPTSHSHHHHSHHPHHPPVTFQPAGDANLLERDHASPSKRTKTELQSFFTEDFPRKSHDSYVTSHDGKRASHDSHMSSYESPRRTYDSHVRSRGHGPHDVPQRHYSHEHHNEHYSSREYESHDHHMRDHAPTRDHQPADRRRPSELGVAYPHHQAPAMNQPGPRGDSWNDAADSSGSRKPPPLSRERSSRGQFEVVTPPTRHPPLVLQRRESLGGFSDDFVPPTRQFSSSPARQFSSSPGVKGGEEISQSSMRFLEVSRALQEHRIGRKRSSATSESDGNGGIPLDPEYQQLLPEDSSDEQLANERGGEEGEGERERERERDGEVEGERGPKLGSAAAGAGGRVQTRGVQSSLSTTDGTQALAHNIQENPRRYPESSQRYASGIQDPLRVGSRRPQQKMRSYEATRRPLWGERSKYSSEQLGIRRSSSYRQTVEYEERMRMGSGVDSRRCYSDSETKVGKDRMRQHLRGHSHPIPPLGSHSTPQTIGPAPIIPAWNSIIHSVPSGGHESSHTPSKEEATLRTENDQRNFEEAVQRSSYRTSDDREGAREREGDEPMQISPNITRSFETSDEISELSTSAQVGSDTTLVADRHLATPPGNLPHPASAHHFQRHTQGAPMTNLPAVSVSDTSIVGGHSAHHWSGLALEGRRSGTVTPQAEHYMYNSLPLLPGRGSGGGEMETEEEGAGRDESHPDSAVSHAVYQGSAPSTFPEADVHGIGGEAARTEPFSLPGQSPTAHPLSHGETDALPVPQTVPMQTAFHHDDHNWGGHVTDHGGPVTGDTTGHPMSAEELQLQTVPAIPMDPAVATVYSGPHAMSPIPEASQEFSSQATTATPIHTASHSHTQFTQSMHSLSPLPEQESNLERERPRHRSTSPFRHRALGESASMPQSPTAVSDNMTHSGESQAVAAGERSQTPQIEPPSSDTSHSLSRSLEVDSSTQATVHTSSHEREHVPSNGYDKPQESNPLGRGPERPSRPDETSSPLANVQTTPVHAVEAIQPLLQATPTLESGPMTDLPLSQQRTEVHPEDHTLSARGEGPAAFVNSGTYQSTISSEGGSRTRGSTPRSTASAPTGYPSHQTGRSRRSRSPGSYVASALSDSVAQQFRMVRKPAVSRQQNVPLRAAVREPSSDWSEGIGDREVLLERGGEGRGSGRRGEREREDRGEPGGGREGGRGEVTYQSSSRITQDLEMMTRAIEGMDSGQQWEASQERRVPQARDDRRHQATSPSASSMASRPSSAVTRSRIPRPGSSASSRGTPTRSRLSTDSRQIFRPITPALAAGRHRSSSAEPSSRYRIAPPSTGHSSRSSVTTESQHTVHARREDNMQQNYNFQNVPTLHNSPVGLSQIAPGDDSPDLTRNPILELGTPNLAQSGTPQNSQPFHGTLSPAQYSVPAPTERAEEGPSRRENVPPPQVGTDSYDYLPPYSPPRNSQELRIQASQRSGVVMVPQAYPDPPPSYEEIFGQQSQGSQRQRHASRHSRGRQESSGSRGSSRAHGEGSHRPSSRTSGQRRLSSLTSLFKRSRRHSHDPGSTHSTHHASPVTPHPQEHLDHSEHLMTPTDLQPSSSQSSGRGNLLQAEPRFPTSPLERTASWVACYDHTPRPLSALQQLERGFREGRGGGDAMSMVSAASAPMHSNTHSQVSRAASDTAAMMTRTHRESRSQPSQSRRRAQTPGQHLPAIPYRHPPPFLSSAPRSHTPTTTYSRSLSTSNHSTALVHSRNTGLNSSQPNIPSTSLVPDPVPNSGTNVPAGTTSSHVQQRILSRHSRTRPSSAIISSSEISHSNLGYLQPDPNPSEQREVLPPLQRLRGAEEGLEGSGTSNASSLPEEHGGRQATAGDGHQQPTRPSPLSEQQSLLASGEGRNLSANGNANNTNTSPASHEANTNATPSPTFTRRGGSSQPGVEEWNGDGSQQQQHQSQTESRVSQNGNETREGRRSEGRRSSSQRSTPRSRAASRRLAQQLSSSDEETGGASSSPSSRGRPRHRRKRGDASSQSSSQHGSQNSPFTSPLVTATPAFFPSFQSQTQPDDVAFSALSTDQLIPTTTSNAREVEVLCNNHVTSQQVSHDQRVTSQQVQSQPTQDTVLPSQDASTGRSIMSPDQSHDHRAPDEAREQEQQPEEEEHTTTAQQSISSTATVEQERATPDTSTTHTTTGHAPAVTSSSSSSSSSSSQPPISKPCGHVCVAVELEFCCQCMKNREPVAEITELLESCEICERRSSRNHCSCVANKPSTSCPLHGNRGQRAQSVPTRIPQSNHNRKHVKNCLLM